jgi:Fic family protein
MNEKLPRRETTAAEPKVITDPLEVARIEAHNVLRQIYDGEQLALSAIERGNFKLRSSHILALHRVALEGLSSYAGIFRPGSVQIGESNHVPPPAHLVAENVEDMCDFINERWTSHSAIYLAAYAMWRLNWIHPFTDGNGRTSRVASYVVLADPRRIFTLRIAVHTRANRDGSRSLFSCTRKS